MVKPAKKGDGDALARVLARIDRRLARIEAEIRAVRRDSDEAWVDTAGVAEMLSITARQLCPDRIPPDFPSPSRIRRRRVWRRSEIELWRASGGAGEEK